MSVSSVYTSGIWDVKEGKEEAFAKRWEEFASGTKKDTPSGISFLLIQSTSNPKRFISIGEWESSDAVKAWRESADFKKSFAELRELCENIQAGNFTARASSD